MPKRTKSEHDAYIDGTIDGAKRVWELISRKAFLDKMKMVYKVEYTPEEMEVIISMARETRL